MDEHIPSPDAERLDPNRIGQAPEHTTAGANSPMPEASNPPGDVAAKVAPSAAAPSETEAEAAKLSSPEPADRPAVDPLPIGEPAAGASAPEPVAATSDLSPKAASAIPAPVHHGDSIDPAPANPLSDDLIRKQAGQTTRRSMIALSAGAVAAYGFYRYLDHAPQPEGQPKIIRDAFLVNQAITQGVFKDAVLAPTYPLSAATDLRINGDDGLKEKVDLEHYRVQLAGIANPKSYGDRYTADLTAWDYKLKDDDEDIKEQVPESTKIDPSKEKHPEARPGQGVGTNDVKGQGGNLDKPGQPPAKSMAQPDKGGKPGDKPEGKDDKDGKDDADKKGAPEKRDRGQEEAGSSDTGLDDGTPGILLKMDDIRKLPYHELVTQFKCIEGWSQIVHWGGVRFADLINAYPPEKNPDGSYPKYVYLETPDGDYYCGYDMIDCMHPQSLLVLDMGGKPLTQFHGAPLRLHMPIKYGYKQLKRIGLIAYTNTKPDDYWTKLGYDWYAGL